MQLQTVSIKGEMLLNIPIKRNSIS